MGYFFSKGIINLWTGENKIKIRFVIKFKLPKFFIKSYFLKRTTDYLIDENVWNFKLKTIKVKLVKILQAEMTLYDCFCRSFSLHLSFSIYTHFAFTFLTVHVPHKLNINSEVCFERLKFLKCYIIIILFWLWYI